MVSFASNRSEPIGSGQLLGRHRKRLSHLIRQVKRLRRARKDAKLCLSIQEQLLASISRLERRHRKLSAELKDIRVSINRAGIGATTRKYAADVIVRLSEQIDECRDFMIDYRQIGDAIAYIYLDRYDIKPMAFKEPPGFITGKSGLRLELKCFRSACRLGRIAILNDLTNCLRYGDITVPTRFGLANIIEVKSGRVDHPRAERQLKKLKEMADFIGKDTPMPLYGYDHKFQRAALTRKGKYNLHEINSLFKSMKRTGIAFSEVEPGLHYLVFDDTAAEEAVKEVLRPIVPGNLCLRISACREAWPSYFPLMFSLQRPDDILDVMFGEAYIWVIISSEEMSRQLEAKGVSVEFEDENTEGPWVLTLKHHGTHEGAISKVGGHFMMRLVAEFASLSWLLEELTNLPEGLSEIPEAPDTHLSEPLEIAAPKPAD